MDRTNRGGGVKLELDPASAQPGYRQLADQIAAGIDGGTLRPADRLPTERGLAAQLGISRMTVRQAFDLLEQRGLIERTVGRGTFVAAPRLDVVRGDRVLGFTELSEESGMRAGATVLHAGVEVAPPEVAAALELPAGARVARITRVRSAGGLPVTLEDSWLPDALFPQITDRDLSGSVYEVMGRVYDRAPARAVETLAAAVARDADTAALGITRRGPLMSVERVAYDAGGTPVEFARDRHRGDRARFVVEVTPRG